MLYICNKYIICNTEVRTMSGGSVEVEGKYLLHHPIQPILFLTFFLINKLWFDIQFLLYLYHVPGTS